MTAASSTRLLLGLTRKKTSQGALSSCRFNSTQIQPRSSNVGQAPNKLQPWSNNQIPRSAAMQGPRFEQTSMESQPFPLAAIDLIQQQAVRMTNSRIAVCDGGGGALGHPRIFINLDKPGFHSCGYCGLRFQQAHDGHH